MEAVISRCACRRKRRRRIAGAIKKRCRRRRRRRPHKVRACYYYAKGDGERRSFTLKDALPGYGSRIPAPAGLSLTNVFVDGMLQSPKLYWVRTGLLRFVSDQPPPADSLVIAQFISIA